MAAAPRTPISLASGTAERTEVQPSELGRAGAEQRQAEPERRVTPLELFFDLVFVLAITQVTSFVSGDPTWTRLLEAMALLAVLWWAWESYAWLGNTAASDEGTIRVVLMAAMGAMLVVSLAVPRAFDGDALVFGVAYLAVRVLHLGAYAVVSRGDPTLRAAVIRLATPAIPAASLLVLAGALDGTARALCWVAALTIDYAGLALSGTGGWRVQPGHFAERHSAIIIIALGESLVALGVGVAHVHVGSGIITAALLAMAVAGALWWAYFDVVAIVAERRFRALAPAEQPRLARDSYTYLHLPMVTGIILLALGLKQTLEAPGAHLRTVPAVALCGGVALYLIALSAFKKRNVGSFNWPRLTAAALLVALIPLATHASALLSLGLVAAASCALITCEVFRYSAARERIRHGS